LGVTVSLGGASSAGFAGAALAAAIPADSATFVGAPPPPPAAAVHVTISNPIEPRLQQAPARLAVGGRLPTPPPELDGHAGVLAAALAAARADHPGLDEAAVRARIEQLSQTWRDLLPADASPRQRARAFATLLFERERFGAVADLDSPETLHIDSVLARRQGYCLSLSVLALAVAEVLGEPLHGVAMPNHFLVRWDDGTTRVNLELTRDGASVSDDVLRATLGDFHHASSIYMRNLGAREVAAVLLHNRGFVASVQGRPERALADLELAARLLPELPEIHRNLGVARAETGDLPGAIASLETALELYPGDVSALINLALAQHAGDDIPAALSALETALLLHPGHARAEQLMQAWSAGHARGGARPLDDPPSGLSPGLLGSYYAGTSFERLVATRVDREFDLDWKRGSPLRGVPADRFSVRWEGWLKAPADGLYTLFVVANDGVRITLGESLAVDHWQDAGYSSWTGTGDVRCQAGWHPLRIEYYDRSDNARLFVLLSRDGDDYPLELAQHLFHQRR